MYLKMLGLLGFGLLLARPVNADIPKTVALATTDWCPYACDEGGVKGIVHEYLETILGKHGIELVVSSYPWSRAIEVARNDNDISGLLTAVYSEAPDFRMTKIPIDTYQVCYISLSQNNWNYDGPSSLRSFNGKLGYVANYGYGEPTDTYISQPENKSHLISVAGSEGLVRLMKLLNAGRIDTLVEDINIVKWYLELEQNNQKGTDIAARYRINGCQSPKPFFLAVNPNVSWGAEFLALLDGEFAKPQNRDLLWKIKDKYLGHSIY
ncbi:hypothetical protein GUA87_13690 [Sneathiella sp. P13V-1]|uniref:hypothetical protein n=1 Tax=Sneathiella sp. P13V-1 TaxID=2697366 RepID=UPI00187BA133|nr:hypothetical protein [Sneathiella sp. P13V-1]MBE7637904.1 hypothetical protein [Sneathiella sp. P13V-1]